MNKKISFANLKAIRSSPAGLADAEVLLQKKHFGLNEIVTVARNPWLELAEDTLRDPMIWFLLGVGTIFIFLGQKSEASVLFIAILPLILMDAILLRRTQASAASLKGQLAFQAKVLREGKPCVIDTVDIVPGDVVIVSSGEYLPADGIFTQGDGLQVDESTLTGEAFAVAKRQATFDPFTRIGSEEVSVDSSALGYAGTRVLTGTGHLRVLFTGRETSYGDIVSSVSNIPHERTPLQRSITRLIQILVFFAIGFCIFLAAVRIYQGHGWLDALLSAATLAVAAFPEEFPVVFTFFLAVGVYRLAKRRALVRRAVSVENIGRVSYICSDKTGTITTGQLVLTHFDSAGKFSDQEVLLAAASASDPKGSDPIDVAIFDQVEIHRLAIAKRLHVFPFTEDRKRESGFVQESDAKTYCYLKGSPESVLARCNIANSERKSWLDKTSQWAREGHKVLACAKRLLSETEVQAKVEPDEGFSFYGLLAFEDPPRKEVAAAMDYCARNKIGVLMITGDHPETAVAIAREVRLGGASQVVVSAELEPEKFEEKWLQENPDFLKNINVVARCSPQQKLRIVNALRQAGELVAVTGDGVNDVPALKAADIGIAMGVRGTRSAKEVASIILTDDNFSTIVNAIMEGRQLFLNLKLSFEYLLLIHIPLVLTAAIIPLLGHPLLYLPIHIVWLELVIHPTALFGFQQSISKNETDGLNIELSKSSDSFFTNYDNLRMGLTGLGVSLALIYIFILTIKINLDLDHARSLILLFLTTWSAAVLGYLTRWRSRSAIVISCATVITSIFINEFLPLHTLLHMASHSLNEYLLTFAGVGVGVLILALSKRVQSS